MFYSLVFSFRSSFQKETAAVLFLTVVLRSRKTFDVNIWLSNSFKGQSVWRGMMRAYFFVIYSKLSQSHIYTETKHIYAPQVCPMHELPKLLWDQLFSLKSVFFFSCWEMKS